MSCVTVLRLLLRLAFSTPPSGSSRRRRGAAERAGSAVRVAGAPDYKLLARAEAKGVQIYKSVEGKDGKLEWALEAPLADLFSGEGKKLGSHYEGPSWEAMDGSKVTRDKGQAVQMAAAPNAQEDIPWLLIKCTGGGGQAGNLQPGGVYSAGQHQRREGPCRGSHTRGDQGRCGVRATYYCYGRAD